MARSRHKHPCVNLLDPNEEHYHRESIGRTALSYQGSKTLFTSASSKGPRHRLTKDLFPRHMVHVVLGFNTNLFAQALSLI